MHKGVTSIIAPGHHAGDKLAEEGDGDAPGGVVHQPELPCPAQHAEEHPPVAGQEAEPEGPPLPPQSIPSQAQVSTMSQGSRVNSSVPTPGMAVE